MGFGSFRVKLVKAVMKFIHPLSSSSGFIKEKETCGHVALYHVDYCIQPGMGEIRVLLFLSIKKSVDVVV